MAKHISNMNQLQKALQPVMIKMVDELAERVYETLNYYLNYYLNDYYTGWTPESYRRTETFLRSAVKIDAHPAKGGVRASYTLITIPWMIQSTMKACCNWQSSI